MAIPISTHPGEADRRSRIAYQAWISACAKTGVSVTREWEYLMDDEKYQWRLVYDDCVLDFHMAEVAGKANT